MNKKLFISSMIVFVLSFSLFVSVEASSTTWTQTYGGSGSDWGTAVVETSDGGFAVAGAINALDDENHAFWLVKTDAYGNMEWNKKYNGDISFVYCLIETLDGGYALACGTVLIKTDSSGTVEWSKTYDGTCNAVVESPDGGYAIAGSKNNGFCLIKTDDSGTVEWSKTYSGPDSDYGYAVVETNDGGYALAGYTHSFGDGEMDFWLVKTDSSGNEEWNQTCGVTATGLLFMVTPFSLVATSDGGYALTGPTSDFTGDFTSIDFCLAKINSLGDTEWIQTYGGPDRDWPTAMVALPDGGFAIAGDTESSGAGEFDFWLIRTDASGNLVWKKTYGGTEFDFVYSMVKTSDGEYALAGRTNSFGSGTIDFWLVKTAGCLDTYEFETYEFDFSYGYGEYVVVISTNSTVGGFDFGAGQDRISFSVTGPTGTTGVAKIIIPEDLTDGDFPVYLNELMLMEDVDYTKTYNGTHTIIDMTYSHSTHMIVITGTEITPEYTTWFIPTLLLATVLLVIINRKKLSK